MTAAEAGGAVAFWFVGVMRATQGRTVPALVYLAAGTVLFLMSLPRTRRRP